MSVTTHFSKDFIYMLFYFPKISNNSKPVLAKIRREIYLVERLKVKILIGNNILVLEGFVLDLLSKKVTIFSYDTKIRILTKS